MEVRLRKSCPFVVAAALALAAAPASAAQPGFAFLEAPAGARAAALGGAYASVARGADAAFWNPAGLADFTGSEFAATHTETYQNLRREDVAIAGRMFGGGIAASFRAFYSEAIEERDDLGNLVGSFGAHDLEFLVGYGGKLASGVSLGLTAQVVRERIADLGATTWAMGAGAAWEPPALAGTRASLSVHNVGPAAHYVFGDEQGEPVPLPAALHAGFSYTRAVFQGFTGLVSLEARTTSGREPLYALGVELDTRTGAALRFGLRGGDDVATWSTGAGWRSRALGVDYAFVPSQLELEDTHRFSLSTRF